MLHGGIRHIVVVSLALAAFACRGGRPAEAPCADGTASCDGACVRLDADPAHCGACGVACLESEVCQAGACAAICGAPLARCQTAAGSRCVDTRADAAHCGACGVACGDGERCTAGRCVNPCAADGWRLCDGRCRQLAVDPRHCGGCDATCDAGQVCSAGACLPAESAPWPKLVVSITADDGFATQAEYLAPELEAHGMRGSFYVVVGRIDLPPRRPNQDPATVTTSLGTAQLRALSTAGHEIGLHGLTHTHQDSGSTPAARIRREICDGRADLLARGFEVRSMAYPFGASDTTTRAVAAECNLGAARDVGGLRSARCPECPAAETWPPAERFRLRCPPSLTLPDDLATLQADVVAAEQGGGGWLLLNFHRVLPARMCADLVAQGSTCFPVEDLAAFLDWLAPRAAHGTEVRTVEQVIGGPVLPAVASGTPPAILGDLESHLDADVPADCWALAGTVTSTAYSTVAGRGGAGAAVQVTVSPWTDGNHTLMQSRGTTDNPDYRSCGTQVTPGRSYRFRCWVRSDVPARLLLYANDGVTHRVASWAHGDWFPASPGAWSEVSFTALVPPTFNTVFFGPSVSEACAGPACLGAPGTATFQVDDCAAEAVGP